MRRFASSGDSATSKPPTATLPSVGGMKPVIMRMVVDLPAPFGPRKPRTSPRSTLNEMPSTARLVPKAFTRFSIRIIDPGGLANSSRGRIIAQKAGPARNEADAGALFALQFSPRSTRSSTALENPMTALRYVRDTALASLLAIACAGALAQTQTPPTTTYEPSVGQAGKDVVWVPTPQALVDKMLDMAKLTPRDYVIDLGSGDGRTVITAAKRGVRAHGIEYNPDMVELSKRNAAQEGVGDKATFAKA